MSSALLQELEEGLQTLGLPRMRYYKILSLFSFENGNEIHFGEDIASFCHDRQQYESIKEYIKEQKKWVRSTETPDITELKLRLWWLQMKMVEFGIFSTSEHRLFSSLFVV